MARRFVTELTEQETLDEIFRAADKQLRANRQGGKYILMKLSDRTGTMTAMLWNADEKVFESFARGDYIRCLGRTQMYNGNLQAILTEVSKVDATEIDLADFDRFDADRADSLEAQLRSLLGGLTNVHLRRVGEAFLADEAFMARLKISPAAVTNHHAYPGGLLQHTVDLMELAGAIAPKYPHIDFELVTLGAFLHDLGKIEELSGEGEATYTDRGQLVGHIVIGVQMLGDKIAAAAEKSGEAMPDTLRWQLEHLILSHHGQLEYGSPKVPMSLEAITLHHLDNLDAKLAAASSLIDSDISSDGNWTNYNPAMGRKFWKPS